MALASVVLLLAACGGGQGGSSAGGSGAGGSGAGGSQSGSGATGGFSWLHPLAPPAGWRVARIASGAEFGYPPGWSRQHSDRGTATAVLRSPGGEYLGYLNLTPRQGDETLSDWASFRIDHNREEGDRAVQRLAAATGLRFLTGNGTCVKDAYTTQTGARFVEIACLVAGARADSVIVGAVPPKRWTQAARTLERAIEAVRT